MQRLVCKALTKQNNNPSTAEVLRKFPTLLKEDLLSLLQHIFLVLCIVPFLCSSWKYMNTLNSLQVNHYRGGTVWIVSGYVNKKNCNT